LIPAACTKPIGEVSHFDSIQRQSYQAYFVGELQPPGGQFQGRNVLEQAGATTDRCYFNASSFPPYEIGNRHWHIDAQNRYDSFDLIGVPCEWQEYYMTYYQGRPCQVRAAQEMLIDCPDGGFSQYATNDIVLDVAPQGVTISRANATQLVPKSNC
ncbi:MAG TPA: hypothetical protein VMM92_08635, partial [Thermoanaerobaculia bacterium]|nr:hypothetical protein [Thermoanaerobaculia bacterium]